MDYEKENEKKKDDSEIAKNSELSFKENLSDGSKNDISLEFVAPYEQAEFVKPKKDFNLELPLDFDEQSLKKEDYTTAQALKIPENEEEYRAKGGCLKAIITTAIIICISILIAIIAISALNDMIALYKPDKQIDVTIPQKAKTVEIAKILKDSKVINNDWEFEIYLKLNKINVLQFGTFSLNSNWGYSEIVKTLKSTAKNKAIVSVTIPEGYTILKIAQTLEDKKICNMSNFLSIIESSNLKYKCSSIVPTNKDRYYKLEGYFFPDTYNFYIGETSTEVATTMLNNFSTKITNPMLDKAKQLNMTFDQVLTLASIIQAEASDTKQMGKVSSVFHNRLEKGIDGAKFLQSDATILYITRSLSKVLTAQDTEVKTTYNTYKHEGLPPGPINNPGLAAINAALNPETTKYFFFVTDSSNNYYYSETFAQHKKAVNKAIGATKGTATVK
jgi:UPF0755 protein